MRLRQITALVMLMLVAFPSFSTMAGAAPLTVVADSESYAPGEEVEISGTAEPNATVTVVIVVNSTEETICNVTVSADEDGEFSVETSLPPDAPEGLYNVTASTDGETAEVSFLVTLIVTQAENLGEGADEEADEEEADEGEEDVEGAALRAIGLREAIKRAYLFIERIQATAARLEERGFEVPDIEANLTEARSHLEAAESYLESFEIPAAARELAEARRILGRTMGWLHRAARRQVKAMKAERFLNHVESRIESLEEKINKLQHRLARGQIVLAALRIARMRLLRIRERLTAGDVDQAVDDLDEAVEEIDDEVGTLNGSGTSTLFREMSGLEAKIRVLNATAEWLAKRGENTSHIEDELQKAKALLEEMMDRLEEGDSDAAEELLEEVREHIEETRQRARITQRSRIMERIKDWIERAKGPRPRGNDQD